MRALAIPTALLMLTAGLAGCLGDDADPAADVDPATIPEVSVRAEWWNGSVPWGEDHDHADYAHHENLSTANFEVLGFDPLVTEGLGSTATGMGCGGTGQQADGQKIAVAHSLGTEVAFVVADITDPANPVKLGEYMLPNAAVWDATVTPDGMHVLVGANPIVFAGRNPSLPGGPSEVASPDAPTGLDGKVEIQPMFKDACTGEVREAGPEQYIPMGGSLVLVGLQDPTDPTFEDVSPQPVIGPHSVSTAEIDGTTYGMSSVTNLVHEASYYTFYEITDTEAGGRLVPLSVIQAPGVQTPTLNGHVEVAMQKHPETGQVLAYLSNWNDGVAIFDMSEPRVPVQIGHWSGASDEGGNIHETLSLPELRDGRHITFAGQEVGEREDWPSGIVYVLDTTDPANPEQISAWTLPVQPRDWPGLMFSTHYLEVVDDTLFVSNYHGGLWAVDITDLSAPRATGLFVPDRPSPSPHENAGGPVVSDVIADENGTLTVWDGNAGIYQIAFDPDVPTSHAPAWSGIEDV